MRNVRISAFLLVGACVLAWCGAGAARQLDNSSEEVPSEVGVARGLTAPSKTDPSGDIDGKEEYIETNSHADKADKTYDSTEYAGDSDKTYDSTAYEGARDKDYDSTEHDSYGGKSHGSHSDKGHDSHGDKGHDSWGHGGHDSWGSKHNSKHGSKHGNYKNGRDGHRGRDGMDGQDGRDGPRGPAGRDGKPGRNGADGHGEDGEGPIYRYVSTGFADKTVACDATAEQQHFTGLITAGAKCASGFKAISCSCDTAMNPAFKSVSIDDNGRGKYGRSWPANTNSIFVAENALIATNSKDKNTCACTAVYAASVSCDYGYDAYTDASAKTMGVDNVESQNEKGSRYHEDDAEEDDPYAEYTSKKSDDYYKHKDEDHPSKKGDGYDKYKDGEYAKKGDGYDKYKDEDYYGKKSDGYVKYKEEDYATKKGDGYDKYKDGDYAAKKGDGYDKYKEGHDGDHAAKKGNGYDIYEDSDYSGKGDGYDKYKDDAYNSEPGSSHRAHRHREPKPLPYGDVPYDHDAEVIYYYGSKKHAGKHSPDAQDSPYYVKGTKHGRKGRHARARIAAVAAEDEADYYGSSQPTKQIFSLSATVTCVKYEEHHDSYTYMV